MTLHTEADVTAVVSFPRVPAVVMVSAVAGIPADVVLSAVDVLRVSALAKVSAVATIPTYVDVLSATGIPMFRVSILLLLTSLL